jgi:transposase
MYLKKAKLGKDKRLYLSAVHGYWENGRSKTKTIKSFGYLDVLEKKHKDPIAYCKEEIKRLEEIQKEELGESIIRFKSNQRLSVNDNEAKNIGYIVLSKIFHDLKINRFFQNRQRHRKLEFSINQVVKLLTYNRILTPASKRKASIEQDFFFESFDLSLDDIYRTLPIINSYKEDLQKHLNNMVSSLYGRDNELVYYDVTNYYFEIDEDDDFRKKGVSKEHRPNPIVQMGFLMDQKGLPIAFDLYPGNTNDCKTLFPALVKSRKNLNLKKIIIVADKGLNTSENIIVNTLKGDGYVFSQSVRKGDKSLKNWILDSNGYKVKNNDTRCKERVIERKINVFPFTGKNKHVSIMQKQVAVYSEKYALRAKKSREGAVQKARYIVQKKQNYRRLLDKTAAKYIKNIDYDEKTGEVIKKGKDIYFDEAKLKEEERYDGYYVISTSEVDKSALEIIDIYQGLWKIEESFRVTKSTFKTRPIYLSKQEHIEAHFMICFISLLILRILETELKGKYSPCKITESLRKANVVYEGGGWYLASFYNDLLDDVRDKMNIDLSMQRYRKKDILSILNATKVW